MRYSRGQACRLALNAGEISGPVAITQLILPNQNEHELSPEVQAELDQARQNLAKSDDDSFDSEAVDGDSEEKMSLDLEDEEPPMPQSDNDNADADDDDGPGYFGDEDEDASVDHNDLERGDVSLADNIGTGYVKNEDVIADSDSIGEENCYNLMSPSSTVRRRKEQEDQEITTSRLLSDFKDYCRYAGHNFVPLPPEYVAGIQLLDILDSHIGSLGDLYDNIYKWHISNLDAATRVTRKSLMKRMTKRYNLKGLEPKQKRIELPSTKARVQLTMHDARAQLVSLLVDPRIKDTDYLFHENNPFNPPPSEFEHVNDINSGLSYRETYKELIEPAPFAENGRRKVLLPIIMYMDGTISGQFANLPIEQLKFTVGILNRESRNHEHAWRILGYVNNYLPEDTKAKDMMAQSKHMDKDGYYAASDSEVETADPRDIVDLEEGIVGDEDNDGQDKEETPPDPDNIELEEKKVPDILAQDLHTMLDKMLGTYRELQEQGLDWDLCIGNKVYPVHFVLYLALFKGDTQEHDKLCGKYTSRTEKVKHLCRYCHVPNEETDDPQADYPRKTQTEIEPLIEAEEKEALQNMSQQLIHNAMYKIRCASLSSDHKFFGIHGITPAEGLHYIQIGKYAYLRGAFFECIGKTSEVAKLLNAHARNVGVTLHRQSDRDKPRTMFTKGLMKGKVMAHEMRGVILVILASIRTTKGRNILMNSKGKTKKAFGTMKQVKDWCQLLQLWLQYEAWLEKEDGHSVHYAELLKIKIRELLELEVKIASRTKGMGNKLFNFHASLHVADDILDHGSPANTNTRSDEMNHKPSKKVAKQTQKIPEKFDFQVATRLHERHMLNLARTELAGSPIWNYFSNGAAPEATSATQNDNSSGLYEKEDDTQSASSESSVKWWLAGTKMVFYLEDGNPIRPRYRVLGRSKFKHRFVLDDDLITTLTEILQNSALKELNLYTDHVRDKLIFRGTPYCYGRPWRDWCLVRWYNDYDEESSMEEIPSSESDKSDKDDSDSESVKTNLVDKPAKRARLGRQNIQNDNNGCPNMDGNASNDDNEANKNDEEKPEYEDLPFHIMCFVDLRELEEGNAADLTPGVYVLGESVFKRKKNRQNRQVLELTNLFTSFTKEIRTREAASGGVTRQIYVAPVDSIVDTAILIPDADHDNCAEYLMMTPRRLWPSYFEQWLESNG